MSKRLYSIGHSNRTLDEFLKLLQSYEISHLVDVRTVPKSRHVPWFNKNELASSLRKVGIQYTHMLNLGGLRPGSKNSINTGWHNASFRGYADYMQTKEFFAALKELNTLIADSKTPAIMCAEAVPWRCHRSLIADAEIIRHIPVYHIMNENTANKHKLTSFAVVNRNHRPIQIYYPPENPEAK
ncbi:DUF488 domain-containing protein [Legionella jordanis]|uniref:DNA repair protein n=1 Tax=Legionella jordanis TaxID=456 RepID=A0A0W0VDZ7_9GAMM|nr:DUF488 domain-containing protein [Legionella jordanis]KTD18312.1 hypothetical protein Ljor_2618 [Legionella jordanis]RMX05230.1 DUF488 domain-containing protein [Legionella jordanis]VEH13343.1 Uncharacterized conserved protein [Legionella jordanis]HAT8713686.1 DUF488 family protein [Legionella jordanis]